MEWWLPIKDFPDYEVSSLGDVRRGDYVLKPKIGPDGYRRYNLYGDGKKATKKGARLVIEAVYGPPPFTGAETRHLDGSKTNDHYANLAWGTKSDNARDRARHQRLRTR